LNRSDVLDAVDAELALKRLGAASRGNSTDASKVFQHVAAWDHPIRHIDYSQVNEAMLHVDLTPVPVASLTSMHAQLNRAAVEKYLHGPEVLEVDGERYLLDGHHRTAAAILRGDEFIPARLVRADADGRVLESEGAHRDSRGRLRYTPQHASR
jgi:hypothetical protein